MSDPYDNARDSKSSVLGPTLKFKGELTADEDLLIRGCVEGSIRHSSSLTVGDGGLVKANVAAEYIVVEGNVEGDLNGTKCVKIRETAKITGNVVSPNVSLVEGAKFNGKIDMDSNPTTQMSASPAEQKSDDAVSDDAVSDKEQSADTSSKEAAAKADNTADERRSAAKKSTRADKKSANAAA